MRFVRFKQEICFVFKIKIIIVLKFKHFIEHQWPLF